MSPAISIQSSHETVVHMLLDAAERAPDSEAIICGEDRIDYATYLNSVIVFAQELIDMGTSGTRIAMVMRNSIDFCIAMFAIQMARAQVVPLNPRYTKNELEQLLKDADVSTLVYDENNSERDLAIAEALTIPNTIAVGLKKRLIQTNKNLQLPQLPQKGELAELLFTGGTTGRSKGTNIDHESLIINLAQREALVPTRPDIERILCVMPLYHCYAINMCLHNMISCRGALIIVEPYDPKTVLETFSKEKITLFGGSPTLFTSLMGHEQFAQTDFTQLHITYSGSAPLSEALLENWQTATDSIVIEGYGQTEAGPVISFNPVNGVRKVGSVGVAVPGTEIEIVDVETGEDVLPNYTYGEIRLRGPQIMCGYRDLPEETAEAVRNGWLYTGDIGELDDEGYLFIRSRKKEMIIVSGFNVYPVEVEGVLSSHAAVTEVAVVGRDDAHSGEVPVAYVVIKNNLTVTEAELYDFCKENLTKYKIPRKFYFIDAIPKTSVGKIDKLTLKKSANDSKSEIS